MRTVAIVGSHPGTRDNAPWNDDIDIWVFNEAANQDWCKRVSAVFQMHSPTIYKNPENRTDKGHFDWLKQEHPYPVYMQEVDPEIPASVKYPLIDVLKLSGGINLFDKEVKYITSSISYAIALAIYQGYEKILVYGIEMASDTEYAYQRDGTTFWIGIALGKGIEVKMYSGLGIFNQPLYGYQSDIEQDTAKLAERKLDLVETLKTWRAAKNDFWSRWMSAVDEGVASEKIGNALSELVDATIEFGKFEGKLDVINTLSYKVSTMKKFTGKGVIDRHEFEIGMKKGDVTSQEKKTEVYRGVGRMDYVFNVWDKTKNPMALQQIKEFGEEIIKTAYESGFNQGHCEENKRLMEELDMNIRAAGKMELLKEA